MTNHDDVPDFWQPPHDGCMFAMLLAAFTIAVVALAVAMLALFR